jgi:hypothetical protein
VAATTAVNATTVDATAVDATDIITVAVAVDVDFVITAAGSAFLLAGTGLGRERSFYFSTQAILLNFSCSLVSG